MATHEEMNVLVACEESQEVCKAFRKRGHKAFSCDIQECSGGHPEWHIHGDVLAILEPTTKFDWSDTIEFETSDGQYHIIDGKWDLIIAFPPCTDLAASGARWFPVKRKDGRQQASISFFMEFVNADCDRIAIENPVGIMSTVYRKPDQIIQPWQHGHSVNKKTCLWLKGLSLLEPSNIVEPPKLIDGALPRAQRCKWLVMRMEKFFHGTIHALQKQEAKLSLVLLQLWPNNGGDRMTNADKIRAMKDEELALFIKDIIVREFRYHGLIGIFESGGYWLDWLRQEVIENGSKTD